LDFQNFKKYGNANILFRNQQFGCAIYVINQNSAVIVPEVVNLAAFKTSGYKSAGFKMAVRLSIENLAYPKPS
jgi:hypothetical protein